MQEPQRVQRALAGLRKAESRHDVARAELHAAIVAALAANTTQADLARATGYSRERIRQIARAAAQAETPART